MYCGNCGAPIEPAARQAGACAYCGIALAPEPSAQPPTVNRAAADLWAEAVAKAGSSATTVTTQSTSYVIDGKTYASLDEMPPEARAKIEAKLAKLAALGLLPGTR